MRLPDTARQIVAGLGGGLAVGATLLGLRAPFLLALPIGFAVYGALLLIIGRSPGRLEIQVADGISGADLQAAIRQCGEGAASFHKLAGQLRAQDADMARLFEEIAVLTRAIGDDYREDPQDVRASSGFTEYHLPTMLTAAANYTRIRINPTVSAETLGRLNAVRQTFSTYRAHVRAILDACQANDVEALTAQTSALGTIMQQEAPLPLSHGDAS